MSKSKSPSRVGSSEIVGRTEPHSSHEMTEWESTIVTLVSTSRFGRFRMCKNCEAEQAETVCGKAMHDELHYPCACLGAAPEIDEGETPKIVKSPDEENPYMRQSPDGIWYIGDA